MKLTPIIGASRTGGMYYVALDNRLLLEDLWAKLALHALTTQGDPT
jgi:hypothetical protein